MIKQEYRAFVSTTRRQVRRFCRLENMNKAPHSYKRIQERAYRVCCETSEYPASKNDFSESLQRDCKYMAFWIGTAPARLDLERFSVRTLSIDRGAQQKEVVDVVMKLEQYNLQDFCLDQEECIERISLANRLLAPLLAESQAVAPTRHRECHRWHAA